METNKNIESIIGDPKKAINRLAYPTILSMLLMFANNLIDSMWVSGLGSEPLAALGFMSPLYLVIIGFGVGIGAGANSLISRLIGAKQYKESNNAALHSIVIASIPFFMTQILASNIGGTSTLIGDPPNIMIGSKAGLSFADFINYDTPPVILILVAFIFIFKFVYGKKILTTPEKMAEVMKLDENDEIKDKPLFIKSLVMIGFIVLGFFFHGALGVESSVIALTAAAIMLIIGKQNVEHVITGVEWPTILFFVGLFVVVGGLEKVGVITAIAEWLTTVTGGNMFLTMILVVWVSAIVSSILDNIPFCAAMIPVILTMASTGLDVAPLWWALSLGACLGGNGTLIGASANVVLSSISTREGHPITFIDFTKVGFPMMLVSVAIACGYLMLRFHGA